MESPTRILIVGSGFSGIAVACALRKAGIDDFVMLEKASDVGGTWRENTYPGAECDVPSALYSFSFEHNPAWQYKWSEQRQILDYLRAVSGKHRLIEKIRFGEEVVSAHWDEAGCCWSVACASGVVFSARYLITGVGQLHRPAIPAIAGAERFAGPSFHSARWRHDVDVTGKQVAVIGNAASALQFIPQVARTARQLSVFQRSANWVLPKQDRVYLPFEQWLSERLPWLTRLYRLRLWLFGELFLYGIMRGNRLLRWWGERETKRYLERTIASAELRRQLTPDYPIGAKRVLFSDDYYAALARANVELVTEGIAAITPTGIRCNSGREIAADILIYGTGFHTNPFLAPIEIVGRGGRRLCDAWQEGAHAYLGMMTAGFPNLGMMYGPNTNLGHNSIVIMIEAQAAYLVRAIQGAEARGARMLEVRPEVEAAYNVEIQQRLSTMAWSQVAESWYKDRGRITNNWPGSTWEYMRRLRRVDWRDYCASS